MKKIIFFALAVLLSATVFSQKSGYRPVMIVSDTSVHFPMQTQIGDLVYVVSTDQMYRLKVAAGPAVSMNYILASASRYALPSVTSTGLSTIGDLTVTGTATVGNVIAGASTFTSATLTTATLGGKALTKKNTNGGNYAGSLTLAAGDTLFLGTQAFWPNNTNGVKANNSITATDSVISTVSYTGKLVSTGNVLGTTVGVSGTDTVTAAPIGSVCYRSADSTLWVKIKLTGTKAERWNKITVSK